MIIPEANVLAINMFGGMSPRMTQYLIDDTSAVDSVNCNMLRGALEPLKANEFIKHKPGKKGLIAYDRDKFVTLDKPNDGYARIGQRVVFTDLDGENSVPMYISADTYDDDSPTSRKYKFGTLPDLVDEWGEDKVSGERTNGPNDAVPFHYVVSVVNRYGDESARSRPAYDINDTANKFIEASDANVTIVIRISEADMDELRDLLEGHEMNGMMLRIYRSILGSYNLVHEAPLPTSGDFMWTDVTHTTESGASKLLDGERTRLPDNVSGFIWHPNGFLACHDDEFVYFSSPLSVSLFPDTHKIEPRGGKIVGLEEYGNRIIVFFDDGPPKTMNVAVPGPGNVQLYSPEIAYRTVSALSVSKSSHGVMYASRDGIVVTDGVRGELLEHIFDAESFNRYAPEDIRGFATDLDYFLFGDGRENLFLQRKRHLTRLSETIVDMSQFSDHVYCLTANGEIHEMFANRENRYREAKWRSKKFIFHRPTLLKSAKMNADYDRRSADTVVGGLGLPDQIGTLLLGDFSRSVVRQTEPARLTLRVIKEDSSFEIGEIRTKYPWNFSERVGGRKSTTYQLEITTNTPVYSIGLAPNIRTFDAVRIPTSDNIEAGNADG